MNTSFSKRAGLALAKLTSWKVKIEQTIPDKCVIIGAHHTSSWDLPLALMYFAASNLPMKWVMKDTMFFFPLGLLWKSLGGIPVNRRVRGNFVDKMLHEFQTRDAFMLVIAPEGTRSYAQYWKSGFYYIALRAQVPILMGFLDFKRKAIGIGAHSVMSSSFSLRTRSIAGRSIMKRT